MIPARPILARFGPTKQPLTNCNPPTRRSVRPHPARDKTLALTIKHTVEFSNNRRTPPEPQSLIASLPGAVPQTYQILSADQIRFSSHELEGIAPACRIRHHILFQGARSHPGLAMWFSTPARPLSPFPAGVRLPGGLTWRTLHTFWRRRHFTGSGLRHMVFPQVSRCFEHAMTRCRAALVTGATSAASRHRSGVPRRPSVTPSRTSIFRARRCPHTPAAPY
jgi:hypothetical protein